ncbi:hypothetical protein CY34DRAFT_29325, partial [Suillus luteus UH-Slu-Lm8-n1]
SYFLQCVPVTENHAVVVTVEEERDAQEGEVLAVTRSKAKAMSPIELNEPQTHAPQPIVTPPSKHAESTTTENPKSPAFRYESKAAAPDSAQRVFKTILETVVPHLTISDLLAISPELRKEAVEHCHTHRVPA